MKLAFDSGGDGTRLLVLLHGLGTTHHVWQRMLADANVRWRGSWLAPDLRGHGISPPAKSYALGHHAADVADLVQTSSEWSEIVVVGHSMGGMIALALATGWFGITPSHAFGLGIKIVWSKDELSRLDEMAAAPVRRFGTKDEAIARYLKVSGLAGLVATDSPMAEAGVVHDSGGWRLAADPNTASVGPPPMRALTAATQAPLHLARGEADKMVTHDHLRTYDSAAVDFSGVGHNAMIENPGAVWDWLNGRLP